MAITTNGPPALRLAYYQAATVARHHDPALAEHYRMLMVEWRHNHLSANCGIARKRACRGCEDGAERADEVVR